VHGDSRSEPREPELQSSRPRTNGKTIVNLIDPTDFPAYFEGRAGRARLESHASLIFGSFG